MLTHNLVRSLKIAIVSAAIIIPAQAFAYTCSNPAICIAVCGSKTCGKIAARDPDMLRLDTMSRGGTGVVTNLSAADRSARTPYTCSNPAICIAVCGKKTCGE